MNGSQRSDYYELLELDRSADEAQIKRAYRRLGREYHPDVNPGSAEAEEKFKQISEAYAVLSDRERRAQYDRYGHNAPTDFGYSASPFDFFDIFASAFGGSPFGFGQSGSRRPEVGRSLRYELEITLDDVLHGVEREISYRRTAACEACNGTGAGPGSEPRTCLTCAGVGQVRASRNTFIGTIATITDCPACQGSGQLIDDPCADCQGRAVVQREETLTVTVPPGVASGNELVMRGFGDAPEGVGGRAGDLHVRVLVAEHDRFVRRDEDLHADLPISFAQAALGDTVSSQALDGAVDARIPAGIQSGERITIRDRGLPRLRGKHRGDLYLHVRVVTPTSLTPRQRELLEALAAESGDVVTPEDKGLFERLRDAFSGQ